MIQKREGYKVIITEPAKSWIKEGKCGGCGKSKIEWKRTTAWRNCSTECTLKFNTYFLYLGWNDVRQKILERDNYTCKKCGYTSPEEDVVIADGKEHKFKHNKNADFDADHIIPVSLSGEEWNFDNIQTLCKQCHKEKTKKDMKKISVERKVTIDQTRLK